MYTETITVYMWGRAQTAKFHCELLYSRNKACVCVCVCRTSWPRWVSPMCWVWVAVAPSPPSCLVPGISAFLLMTLCGITCCPGSHRLCISLVRPHSHITAIEQDYLRFLMHMITKHSPCCHHCVWTMLYFCDSARRLHSRLYAVGWVSSGNTIEAAGYEPSCTSHDVVF